MREIAKFTTEYNDQSAVEFFGLGLDTHSSIMNFLPVDRPRDPSFRSFGNLETKLFPPVFILQFRRDDVRSWWLTNDEGTLTSVLSELLMNQGRFLWKAFKHDSLDKDIEFGCTKLLGGRHLDAVKADQKISNEELLAMSMAILGSRVAVTFHCSEQHVTRMINSHMGVCYYLEPRKNVLVYGYPSEPLLSLSSALLLSSDLFSWTRCLKRVMPFLQQGLVGAGVRGELICRILLSMAWDSCQLSMSKGHRPCLVSDFFRQLGGPRLLEEFQETHSVESQNAILNGQLYFTHFVYVNYKVTTVQMLEKFLSCGQAVICRNNQQAVDLLIPFVLSDKKRVSFIAIQCKNRKSMSWTSAEQQYDATKIGFGSEFQHPYVVLCMHVGTGGRIGITNLMSKSSNFTETKNIIAMNGLDETVFPVLKDAKDFVEVLRGFQASWEDPLSYFESQKGREVEESLLRTVMEPTYGWKNQDSEDLAMNVD